MLVTIFLGLPLPLFGCVGACCVLSSVSVSPHFSVSVAVHFLLNLLGFDIDFPPLGAVMVVVVVLVGDC